MKWEDVRVLYPDKWVKIKIIHSHNDDEYLYVDDMEVINVIDSDWDATIELRNTRGNHLVFHTSHDTIKTKLIKNMGLFRRIPTWNLNTEMAFYLHQ